MKTSLQNTKHSPGPWELHPCGYEVQTRFITKCGDKIFATIATIERGEVFTSRDNIRTDAEASANADLICAAPELLENLQNLVASELADRIAKNLSLNHSYEGDGTFFNGSKNPSLERARAAIAKATGTVLTTENNLPVGL